VGLTESLLSLVFAVGLGLSLSTTAMVARRIGEKDPSGASVAGVQAIVLGLAVSLVIGCPAFFLRRDCCSLWAHRRKWLLLVRGMRGSHWAVAARS